MIKFNLIINHEINFSDCITYKKIVNRRQTLCQGINTMELKTNIPTSLISLFSCLSSTSFYIKKIEMEKKYSLIHTH